MSKTPASKTTVPAKGAAAKPAAKEYKLTYFDGRGRAEVSRLLFAAAKVKYEDVRIKQEDWPKLKESTPLGSLPVLKEGNFELCQSMAIARHLARSFDLYGKTPEEKAKVDMALDTVDDLKSSLFSLFFASEEKKAEGIKTLKDEKAPKILNFLAGMVASNKDSKYIVGKSLTVADCAVYDVLESLMGMIPDALDKFTAMKENRKKVAETDGIKSYLASRKATPF